MANSFEALRRRFRERCSSDLAVLQQSLDSPNAIRSTDLKTLAHQMSGAATAFGFPQLNIPAMRLESQVANGTPPSPELVQALIDELRAI
jgi:HPt (histidine-containing phosphotransfer) domain-containing protein